MNKRTYLDRRSFLIGSASLLASTALPISLGASTTETEKHYQGGPQSRIYHRELMQRVVVGTENCRTWCDTLVSKWLWTGHHWEYCGMDRRDPNFDGWRRMNYRRTGTLYQADVSPWGYATESREHVLSGFAGPSLEELRKQDAKWKPIA